MSATTIMSSSSEFPQQGSSEDTSKHRMRGKIEEVVAMKEIMTTDIQNTELVVPVKRMAASSTVTTIPCCICGTTIIPNSANQCGACLTQGFDLKVCVH